MSISTRPKMINALLEFRAAFEGMTLLGAYPLLKQAPKGNGQPVLVIPGFATSDNGTYFLRQYLSGLGYQVYGWEQGINRGLSSPQYKKLEQRVKAIAKESGQAVALVGWNVGGLYARAIANDHSAKVSMIITLAAPFAMPSFKGVSASLGRLYAHYSELAKDDAFNGFSDVWERTPDVPSTSLYSRTDGIFNWRYCLDKEGVTTENIRVLGSHLGLAINPMAYFIIAERLSQDVNRWRHFADTRRSQALVNTLLSY